MLKKNQQKHSKKKSVEKAEPKKSADDSSVSLNGELPGLASKNKSAFHLAAESTAEEMFAITKLTDAQLRQQQLVKDDAGNEFFPKPALGKWNTVATLAGLMALREWRASKSATPKLDTISFQTMESCEGATGISKSLQQLAKSKGCAAFRGPRVYLMDLVKWIFKEGAAGNVVDWGKLNNELDAKLKWVELEASTGVEGRPGKLLDRAQVEAFTSEFAAICFGAMKRWKMEIPRDYEMRDKAYIKTGLEKIYSQAIAQANAALEKLKQESPQLQPQSE